MEHSARRPHGHVEVFQEFGGNVVRDTSQCPHCGGHFIIQPGSGKLRSWCYNCAAVTCGQQGCVQRCFPQEKMLERIEKQAAKASRGY